MLESVLSQVLASLANLAVALQVPRAAAEEVLEGVVEAVGPRLVAALELAW